MNSVKQLKLWKRFDNQLDELTDDLEQVNSSLIAVRDALWAIERDRLRTAEAIIDLASGTQNLIL